MDPLFLSPESKLFGLTIFISIVAFQIVYVLVQWFYIKRMDYLFYAAYMFSIIIYGLSLYKEFLIFYPFTLIYPNWYDYVSLSLPLFSVLLYYRFSRAFLNLNVTRPKLSIQVKKLELFLIAYLLLTPLLILGNVTTENWFIVFNIVCIITVIASGFIITSFLKKSIALERFAMLGASLLVVGSIFDISFALLESAGKEIPCDAHLPLLICVISELMTFTTGLAYKTQLIEKENVQSVTRLLNEIHEKQRLEIDLLNVRNNISRDLHDNLGAELSTAKMMLNNIKTETSLANTSSVLENSIGLINSSIQKLYGILNELQNTTLLQKGYVAATEELVNKISPLQKIEFSLSQTGLEQRLDKKAEHHLFRTTQELINNTLKYAHASNVTISITKSDHTISFVYEDDGIGFDLEKIERGNGMNNIESRVKELNGSTEFDSTPEKGMRVIIHLPVLKSNFN